MDGANWVKKIIQLSEEICEGSLPQITPIDSLTVLATLTCQVGTTKELFNYPLFFFIFPGIHIKDDNLSYN